MVAALQPVASGYAGERDISIIRQNNPGVLFIESYIKISCDGKYTFYLSADTKAVLRIHDAQVTRPASIQALLFVWLYKETFACI